MERSGGCVFNPPSAGLKALPPAKSLSPFHGEETTTTRSLSFPPSNFRGGVLSILNDYIAFVFPGTQRGQR